MKVLIIGKNAYLAEGVETHFKDFDIDTVRRAHEVENWGKYDAVVNFCIQPEHFSRLLSEDEMIDVEIVKKLAPHTRFVFMSSRKVYGSDTKLKEYKEKDALRPCDFYAKNKVNIEQKLQNLLGDRLLILRISNILGLPPKRNSPTFVSWLASEVSAKGKVTVTADPRAKKDFITKDYFQETLSALIAKNVQGVVNVGSNFAYTTEDLLKKLVPQEMLEFEPKEEKGEQFILNCEKLHQFVPPLSKSAFETMCQRIRDDITQNVIVKQKILSQGRL